MVGSARPREVDVRVLAATNKDLRTLVKNEVLREDLYFRLNVIAISMPPLRDREDDILLLTSHLTTKFAEESGKPVPRFSDDALQTLRSYHWPGNVRELENLIQRVVVMTDHDVIKVSDLPSMMRFTAGREAGLDRTLVEVEAEHIRNVLASVRGNKTRAAEILGIDRKTLREKIKLYEPKRA
jgi:DNA-binding NtrC family response regulator